MRAGTPSGCSVGSAAIRWSSEVPAIPPDTHPKHDTPRRGASGQYLSRGCDPSATARPMNPSTHLRRELFVCGPGEDDQIAGGQTTGEGGCYKCLGGTILPHFSNPHFRIEDDLQWHRL